MTRQEAIARLVETLAPFKVRATEPYGPATADAAIRDIVRAALQQLDVYDAHGCPLCLS